MPYTKARLLEALRVIREDNRRLHTLEADKLARTQYRDGFHLRKPTATLVQPVQLWREDDSSDEEYDPFRKKRRLKKVKDDDYGQDITRAKNAKTKAKTRQVTSGIESENCEGKRMSKRPKLEHPDNQLAASSVFITLELKSGRGQLFLLQKLRGNQDTHINIYQYQAEEREDSDPNLWRLSSGGLHRTSRSGSQHAQDCEVARALQEPLEQLELRSPRKLRSGKVRAELVPKKRNIDEIEDDEEEDVNVGVDAASSASDPFSYVSPKNELPESKKCRIDNHDSSDHHSNQADLPFTPTRKSTHSSLETIRSGSTIDDAISIASSSPRSSRTVTPDTSPLANVDRPSYIAKPASSYFPLPAPRSSMSTITTNFCHPINFRSLYAASCTFHTDYRHPILGHGPVTVDCIIDSMHPSQLIETNDGHRSKGIPADKMCVPCSLTYIQIIRCATHTFTRLPQVPLSADAQKAANIAYVRDLYTPFKRGDPRRNTKALTETCRLCPAPATYRCTTAQLHDKCLRPCRLPNEGVEAARVRIERDLGPKPLGSAAGTAPVQIQPAIQGCGFILCSTCYRLVNDTCGGQMQENRDMILHALKRVGMGARADAEFLFKEGLVWKAYN